MYIIVDKLLIAAPIVGYAAIRYREPHRFPFSCNAIEVMATHGGYILITGATRLRSIHDDSSITKIGVMVLNQSDLTTT